MTDDRPPIPRPLRRQVLTEAGHRCAIPTCRRHPVEVHHIKSWARVREHTFDNLIALCPTCHARVTSGEIDRLAVAHYKSNLMVLNGRYHELERRLLLQLGEQLTAGQHPGIYTTGGLYVLYGHLVRDGLVEECDPRTGLPLGDVRIGMASPVIWRLTEKGEELAIRVLHAEPLDDEGDDGDEMGW